MNIGRIAGLSPHPRSGSNENYYNGCFCGCRYNLVPPNRLTSIRIRFFTLRLTRSGLHSPRYYIWKDEVERHMAELEQNFNSKKNFELIDWDSGFSDG